MFHRNRFSRRTAGLVPVLFLVGGVVLTAQDAPPGGDGGETGRPIHVNDREALHRDLPIRIIGLEETGNSFRDRTPLLEQCDHVATMVDVEELYRRKRALYEEGGRFPSPLPVPSGAPAAGEPPGEKPPVSPAPPPARESSWSRAIVRWILPGGLFLILAGLMAVRRRLR